MAAMAGRSINSVTEARCRKNSATALRARRKETACGAPIRSAAQHCDCSCRLHAFEAVIQNMCK